MKPITILGLLLALTSLSQAQITDTEIKYIAISPNGKHIAYSGGMQATNLRVIDRTGEILQEKHQGPGSRLRFLDDQNIQINQNTIYDISSDQYRRQIPASRRLHKSKLLLQLASKSIQLQTMHGLPLANFHFYNDSLRYQDGALKKRPNIINYLDGSRASQELISYDIVFDNHFQLAEWSNTKLGCDHAILSNVVDIHPKEQELLIAAAPNKAAFISLTDLKIQNLSIHLDIAKAPIIGAKYSPKGDKVIIHNDHQLEILDVNNLKNIKLSKALSASSKFRWISPRAKEIIGLNLDQIFFWDYQGKQLRSFEIKGKLLLLHPLNYIISYDKKAQKIYCYHPKGTLVKELDHCMLPAAMLQYQSFIMEERMDQILLSQDGKTLICLDAKNPQSIKIIDLSQLK